MDHNDHNFGTGNKYASMLSHFVKDFAAITGEYKAEAAKIAA